MAVNGLQMRKFCIFWLAVGGEYEKVGSCKPWGLSDFEMSWSLGGCYLL